MRDRPRSLPLAILLIAVLPLSACQTTTGTALDKKSTQGAIAGAILGAAAGAAADDHKRGRGALIGAAVGGLAGGLIGHTLDRQAQEVDAIPDAAVERRDDRLFVAFPSDVLFDVDSRALHAGAYGRLNQLADSLVRHPGTEVVVKGHTDSTGGRDYNLRLSEDRADAVRRYLIAQGVPAARVQAIGLGDTMPVASNETQAGRQQNRRVEFEIRPSAEMREEHRLRAQGTGAPGADPYASDPPTDDRYDPYEAGDGPRYDPYGPDEGSRYDDPYEVR
ncbi:MAG: hypothetical protein CL910_00570 [Deltaproteobacteria bacterium]|jgi:outer membrane protein OmpA-like peptidoglycan-associated protein|nr:hypothetical protein [Deltaproteobacteria bacterium]